MRPGWSFWGFDCFEEIAQLFPLSYQQEVSEGESVSYQQEVIARERTSRKKVLVTTLRLLLYFRGSYVSGCWRQVCL